MFTPIGSWWSQSSSSEMKGRSGLVSLQGVEWAAQLWACKGGIQCKTEAVQAGTFKQLPCTWLSEAATSFMIHAILQADLYGKAGVDFLSMVKTLHKCDPTSHSRPLASIAAED